MTAPWLTLPLSGTCNRLTAISRMAEAREVRQQRISNHVPFSTLDVSRPGIVRPCLIWNKCRGALGAPGSLLSRSLVGLAP